MIARCLRPGFLLAGLVLLAGCAMNTRQIQEPPRSLAVPTAWPWTSMIYLARTDSGVVVIDLGWNGAGGALRRSLDRMGSTPEEVSDVFLTHSHRDHIGAWRVVRSASFHLAQPEASYFVGDAHHRDLPSRLGERLLGRRNAHAADVRVESFSRDTAFSFGADTLHAFVVPGHTAGSAAYLFRGVLFVGDAVARNPLFGFGGAMRIFTADSHQARGSLESLRDRVAPRAVHWVCTAHAKCAVADSLFWRKVLR